MILSLIFIISTKSHFQSNLSNKRKRKIIPLHDFERIKLIEIAFPVYDYVSNKNKKENNLKTHYCGIF